MRPDLTADSAERWRGRVAWGVASGTLCRDSNDRLFTAMVGRSADPTTHDRPQRGSCCRNPRVAAEPAALLSLGTATQSTERATPFRNLLGDRRQADKSKAIPSGHFTLPA